MKPTTRYEITAAHPNTPDLPPHNVACYSETDANDEVMRLERLGFTDITVEEFKL